MVRFGRLLPLLFCYFGLSFLLHFAWEMGQAPFFAEFGEHFWQHVWACLFATATGDMLFMLVIYLVLAISHANARWIVQAASYRHPATWLLPPIVGVLLASCFELWAVHAVGRWTYDGMPTIPQLHVGLLPILQMIVIPLAVLATCRLVAVQGGSGQLRV